MRKILTLIFFLIFTVSSHAWVNWNKTGVFYPEVILAEDGSASAPAYSFASDTDMGIRQETNQLILQRDAGNSIVLGSFFSIVNGGAEKWRWIGSDYLAINNGNIGDSSTNNPTNIFYDGKAPATPQSATCADSGDANPSTLLLEPTSDYIEITNSDANGCDVTMSETNAVAGHRITIVVVSNAGGNVVFADTSGVSETTGAISLDVWDSLEFVYASDRWVEISTSNN